MRQTHIFTRILLLILLVHSFIASGQKTVLFDEHHGQFFSTEKSGVLQLSGLSEIFKEEGWKWGGDWKRSKDWMHFYRPEVPYNYCGKIEVEE